MFKKIYFRLSFFFVCVLSVFVLSFNANADANQHIDSTAQSVVDSAAKKVIQPLIEEVHHAEEASHADGGFKPTDLILHHIADAHEWHFIDIGHTSVTLSLPVIIYSKSRGLEVFSSSNFVGSHHGPKEYNGYVLDNHEKISFKNASEGCLYDFSITKNVASTMIAVVLMVLVFLTVSKAYRTNRGKAPSGIQSFMEPIILYIQDVVILPNLGAKKAKKFAPYLLTLFFFILFNNLMGLIPGGANSSGNIAFTCALALITFVVTNVNGNKNYWGHIFAPPGVPIPLYIIMWPVEIIGLFTKPFSLTVRLFANITAGHIIILSLFSFIFIFQSAFVGVGSSIFVVFMTFLEILVAFVQPFIFTMLSALYIGAAVEEHHH